MAKGTIAKTNVATTLQEAFGVDWIGEFDKKLYVWADDGGEKVQIAISLTCPKNYVGEPAQTIDMTSDEVITPTPSSTRVFEISPEEQMTIENLMQKLGL